MNKLLTPQLFSLLFQETIQNQQLPQFLQELKELAQKNFFLETSLGIQELLFQNQFQDQVSQKDPILEKFSYCLLPETTLKIAASNFLKQEFEKILKLVKDAQVQKQNYSSFLSKSNQLIDSLQDDISIQNFLEILILSIIPDILSNKPDENFEIQELYNQILHLLLSHSTHIWNLHPYLLSEVSVIYPTFFEEYIQYLSSTTKELQNLNLFMAGDSGMNTTTSELQYFQLTKKLAKSFHFLLEKETIRNCTIDTLNELHKTSIKDEKQFSFWKAGFVKFWESFFSQFQL